MQIIQSQHETDYNGISAFTKGELMRVLIADDHDLVRESIAAILRNDDFTLVELAANLQEAIQIVNASDEPFDIILLDYDMPGMNGLDGLKKMVQLMKDCPVALLSGTASDGVAYQALETGAKGFISKTLNTKSMIAAIKLMLAGEIFAPIEVLKAQSESASNSPLSKRETEVLRGICDGKSNKEIALLLDLQEVTIKLHVKTISRKLDARNRTHAAMIARDMKLI